MSENSVNSQNLVLTIINETSMFTFSILCLSTYFLLNHLSEYLSNNNDQEDKDFQVKNEIIDNLTDSEVAENYIKFLESLNKKNIDVETKANISSITFRDEDPRVLLVYATQSNTSKIFAETIKKESQINNLKVQIKNISEISNNDFKSNIIMLFFVATYGEGEPTDDALNFFKNLDKIEKHEYLHYSIFGLGSTKYEKFNQTAINLDNHFKTLRFQELIPLTLGDDSINIRKDFDSYKEYLYHELNNFFIKISKNDRLKQFITKNKLGEKLEDEVNEFEVIIENVNSKSKLNDGLKPNIEDFDYSLKNYLSGKMCNIKNIMEMRKSNNNGSTLKITYDLNELNYETGDNIGIYPTNNEESVDFILKRLKLDPESVIRVFKKKIKLSKKISIPDSLTIRELLTNYLDLSYKIE